jgi:anti-sigma regulatory factor (Ser/Thr protein kinase)
MGEEKIKDSAVITIPSHSKYLSIVRAVSARMAELFGMDDREVEDVKLAVDEACSNVIKHAYRGDTDKRIVVNFTMTERAFEVIIDDEGIKADPESIEGRNLNDIRPGGLGIHLIRRAFDVLSFDETRRVGNRLRLVRYRKEANGT